LYIFQNYFLLKILIKKIFINKSDMNGNVPITRLGKFFGSEDFDLEIQMGQEWLIGDMNFTCVLYRVYDSENFVRYYTVVDDGRVYSDLKHTYKGYKPYYRTIIGSYVGPNEFRGL